MKKFLKIIGIILLLIVVGVGGLITYVKTCLPDVGPPPDLKVEVTPERLQRGYYLAHSVCVCMDCHSTRDWSRLSGPLLEGTLGKGGEEFNQDFGFPGRFFSRNITPAGIGSWTDGEVFRAITAGVSRDGGPLFPLMPHPNYGQLDKEDIYSVIAYIRSLQPIENKIEPPKFDFPMNIIINTIPKAGTFTAMPPKSDKLAYGKYLFTAASCSECHTKKDKGAPVPGMEMAGDFEFKLPKFGIVRSANLTPDEETGIGLWTEDFFVNRFKSLQDSSYVLPTVGEKQFQTVMPWMMYSTMKEEDLRAIYTYLRTLPAIKHRVEKFTPAS